LCDFQSSPLFSIPATASKNRARHAISVVAAAEVTAKFNPARPVAGLLWGRIASCGRGVLGLLCDFQSSPLFSIPATASKNRARQTISFVAAAEVTAKFNPARPMAGLLWGRLASCGRVA